MKKTASNINKANIDGDEKSPLIFPLHWKTKLYLAGMWYYQLPLVLISIFIYWWKSVWSFHYFIWLCFIIQDAGAIMWCYSICLCFDFMPLHFLLLCAYSVVNRSSMYTLLNLFPSVFGGGSCSCVFAPMPTGRYSKWLVDSLISPLCCSDVWVRALSRVFLPIREADWACRWRKNDLMRISYLAFCQVASWTGNDLNKHFIRWEQ